ncbi:hypothetical protein DFJ74DRAFT_767179, partial [Hyaloraphidium curvatum]
TRSRLQPRRNHPSRYGEGGPSPRTRTSRGTKPEPGSNPRNPGAGPRAGPIGASASQNEGPRTACQRKRGRCEIIPFAVRGDDGSCFGATEAWAVGGRGSGGLAAEPKTEATAPCGFASETEEGTRRVGSGDATAAGRSRGTPRAGGAGRCHERPDPRAGGDGQGAEDAEQGAQGGAGRARKDAAGQFLTSGL